MKTPSYLQPAKTRIWTEQEALEAMDFVQRERPDVVAEIERLEAETGDLRESTAVVIQGGLLQRLHPECEFNEITQLQLKIRNLRRKKLNLE